jgi:antitoxin component of MazEF toxin-antitoxin module
MQVKLISVGNSFGIRIPKNLVKQFSLEKGKIELVVKEEGILLKSIPEVPPLDSWDQLFENAEKDGFNAVEDAGNFNDFENTLLDGIE